MQRILFALDVGIDYMYISNSLVGLLKGVAVYQGCASVCVRICGFWQRQDVGLVAVAEACLLVKVDQLAADLLDADASPSLIGSSGTLHHC